MTRKQVKEGAKVYFIDEPNDIGTIGDFDGFGINIYFEGKSILWNPLTISWLEIRDWSVVL